MSLKDGFISRVAHTLFSCLFVTITPNTSPLSFLSKTNCALETAMTTMGKPYKTLDAFIPENNSGLARRPTSARDLLILRTDSSGTQRKAESLPIDRAELEKRKRLREQPEIQAAAEMATTGNTIPRSIIMKDRIRTHEKLRI